MRKSVTSKKKNECELEDKGYKQYKEMWSLIHHIKVIILHQRNLI